MKESVVSKLSAVWMTVAVISLILPVFLPSYPDPHQYGSSVIEAATVTMFVLSFPASLLGLPLVLFSEVALGFDPATMSGRYFTLVAFFSLGLAQWFRIVPWIFRRETVELGLVATDQSQLGSPKADFCSAPSREKSPVDEVILVD